MTAGWDRAMDAFATRLTEQRAALLAGTPDSVPPFAPPPSLGPLPEHLRQRAEALVQEAVELQAELAMRLASTTREAQAVRQFLGAGPRPVGAGRLDGAL